MLLIMLTDSVHSRFRSYFIFMNTIIIVISCALGILVIVLTERKSGELVQLGESVDKALSFVQASALAQHLSPPRVAQCRFRFSQPSISIGANVAFLTYGRTTHDLGPVGIATIQRMFVPITAAPPHSCNYPPQRPIWLLWTGLPKSSCSKQSFFQA